MSSPDARDAPRGLTQAEVNDIIFAVDGLLETAASQDPPLPDGLMDTIRVGLYRGLRNKIIAASEIPSFRDRMIASYRQILADPTTAPQPRSLTQEEIDHILNQVTTIAPPTSPSPEVQQQMLDNMKRLLSYQLRNIRLTPLGIDPLITQIVNHYLKALVTYGTNVGGFAADAISVHITQGALDSFHRSGSAKNVTSGVRSVEELLNASAVRGSPSSTISFLSPITLEQVLTEKVAEMVQLKVIDHKSFAERLPGQSKVDPHNLKNNGVTLSLGVDKISNLQLKDPANPDSDQLAEPWWYSAYRALVDPDFPSMRTYEQNLEFYPEDLRPERITYQPYEGYEEHAARLVINLSKVYRHRIRMEDIAQAIESTSFGGYLKCLPSPVISTPVVETRQGETIYGKVAFVDIFVRTTLPGEAIKPNQKLPPIVREQKGLFFIQSVLIPKLPDVLISGIRNIEELYPLRNSVTSMIMEEMYIGLTEQPRSQIEELAKRFPEEGAPLITLEGDSVPVLRWRLLLDYPIMNKKGINPQDIVPLLRYVGFMMTPDSIYEDEGTAHIDIGLPIWQRPDDFIHIMNLKQEPDPSAHMSEEQYQQVAAYPEIGTNFMLPRDYINYLILRAEQHVSRQTQDNRQRRNALISEGRLTDSRQVRITPPAPDILSRSEFIMVDADGENMVDVYNMSDVDPNTSYGNNLHQIIKTFGVEALRTYLIEELILATGSSYYPRHAELIVDYMLRLGFISSFTSAGYERQKNGPFPDMLMQSKKSLSKAAAFAQTYDVKPLSSALIMGQRTRVGAGMVNVRADPEYERQLMSSVNGSSQSLISAQAIDDEFWRQREIETFAYIKPNGEYTTVMGSSLPVPKPVVVESTQKPQIAAVPQRVLPPETSEVYGRLDEYADVFGSVASDDLVVEAAFPPGAGAMEAEIVSVGDTISLDVIEEGIVGDWVSYDPDAFEDIY